MIATNKVLALLLASLPFQSLGQSCSNNRTFEFGLPNVPGVVDCNWIDRNVRRVEARRTRVCTTGSEVLHNCLLACNACPPISSAVFTMTNAANGNEIMMHGRNEDTGELAFTGSSFSTQGVGGDSTLEAPPNDPLASQNSLVVADNCLLAVNAGSNTLTSFQILVELGLIEGLKIASVVGSGGDIPVSVTYSKENRFVYALNAGGSGSVSGYTLNEGCVLEPIPMSIVSLNQDLSLRPDDSPPYFLSSPAQIGFSPNGERLLVTIKGMNGDPRAGGTINYFDVSDGTGLVSNLQAYQTGNIGIVPFSFDFDDEDNLLVVDAFGKSYEKKSGRVTMYNFEGINDIGSSDTRPIIGGAQVGQTGTCRIKYSNGCAFTTNNGSSSISSLIVTNGRTRLNPNAHGSDGTALGVVAEMNNPIDEMFSPDGKYLYALSTGHTSDTYPGQPQIYVYDVRSDDCGLSEVQAISDGLPTEFVTGFGVVGLAVF